MVTSRCLIQCRVERKYLLEDRDVPHFLSSLGPVLSNSEFRKDQGRITSVYFDRPDRVLSRTALSSPSCNMKVRLREYFSPAGVPSSPFVWIEVKDREGATSRKNRFQLHKRLIGGFFRGEVDEGTVLTCQGGAVDPDRVVDAVRRIRGLADGEELVPVGSVSCRRLALEGGNPRARVTLDQDVAYHLPPLTLSLDRESLGVAALEERSSIVEIKFRGRSSPDWCRRGLGNAAPAEYSKFRILSALALCEQRVD